MSLDELVDYFLRYRDKLPRKPPNIEVSEQLRALEKTAREDGLHPHHILQLVDVAACGKLAISLSSRLVRVLIPAGTVPELAVLKAVSWMCTNKPPSSVQTLLVRWIILVYEFLDGHDKLHALYGIIFYFLENEQMCPYVCHLLYLLTRREDVVLFRLRALINLQQRVGRQPYLIGLFSIYKLYSPQLVTIILPRVPKSFFKQTDLAWGAVIRRVQEKHAEHGDAEQAEHGDAEQTSPINRSTLSPKKTVDAEFLAPLAKRRRLQLVPMAEVCTVRAERINSFSRCPIKATKVTVPITLIASFDELLNNLDNVEMPARLSSVLRNANLQHIVSLQIDPVTAYRLSYWVHQALGEEFSCEPSPTATQRQGQLLELLVLFSDFLQESMPVWENFLTKYLHTWNGVDHRQQIFKLIARIRLTQPTALNELVLEPLRKLFFTSSVYFKCQVLWCLTRLLRNYIAVEMPRYEGILRIQADSQIAADTPQPDFQSMFEEDVERFPHLEALNVLLRFVDTICVVALPAERHHGLLNHCLIDFFMQLTTVFHMWGLPLLVLPHRANFYCSLFSPNAVVVARTADLMTRYRQTFKDLQDFQKSATTWGAYDEVCRQSLQKIRLFNCMLSDMGNTLWRPRSLYPTKPESVYALLETSTVSQLKLVLENDAFQLLHHPALRGHVLGFLKQTRPRITKIPSTSLREVLDRFLLYLDAHHVTAISTFISTNIRRSRITDMARSKVVDSAKRMSEPSETAAGVMR